VLLLLLATTETKKYETGKKKSQPRELKRQGKGKHVPNAGEGKVRPPMAHASKTHFDILQTLRHPHRKSHPPSLFSLLGLLRSRTRRMLPLLKGRTQATTAKPADLRLVVVD
jgi:hypothetical protein